MPARKRIPGSTKRMAPDGDGASAADSGGGNASGTPDAETAMRLPRPPGRSNVKKDKAKLFPASARAARASKPLKTHGDKFGRQLRSGTR